VRFVPEIPVSRRKCQNLLDDRFWNFQGANVLLAGMVVIGGECCGLFEIQDSAQILVVPLHNQI
jgi:hypothetical protein